MFYASFKHAMQAIDDIQPIDYFFAKEVLYSIEGFEQNPEWASTVGHMMLALSESARQGHTCLPLGLIGNHIYGRKVENDVVTHQGYQFPPGEVLEAMADRLHNDSHELVKCFQNSLYMRRNYCFERELQQQFQTRLSSTIAYDENKVANVIQRLFPKAQRSQEEIDWQLLAVSNSVNKRFSIIAGGPGTGKTYTVTKLLAALVSLQDDAVNAAGPNDGMQNGFHPSQNIGLVAPTGKAAQRLTESLIKAIAGFKGQIDENVLEKIPTQAQTIHRLLGVIPHQNHFKHGADNQLALDVLIIDEVSMVDLALMVRLFRALPDTCQVIMLGDADQLPSVGLGSVLSDIAHRPHLGYSKSNADYLATIAELSTQQVSQLPKVRGRTPSSDHLSLLMKSRRFDGEGAIGNVALAVIAGNAEQSWQYIAQHSNKRDDISQLPVDKSWLAEHVKNYYQPLMHCPNLDDAFALLTQYRILCATRVGYEGVQAINQGVIEQLKGHYREDMLFHGMPIMVNENHYGLKLYNGDVGIIWRNQDGHLFAVFEGDETNISLSSNAQSNNAQPDCVQPDNAQSENGQSAMTSDSLNDRYRYIIPSRLPQFEPVYAMTIHKTQGSEFSHVALVLPSSHENQLLSRELIYTGVTRAKQKISICATESSWYQGVEARVERHSHLSI
ncbi:exodeoxyribonuclease V subunit alpha [Thalassotalea euphylliae]|uniref:exodeoxyribonuclease V subunit alpha n=1 Tax=Thalassotalea euphylliae TaxID=1655234 RepID=UPI003625E640